MKIYDITRSESLLQIRRRKGWIAFRLAFFCFFSSPMLVIPIAMISTDHRNVAAIIILMIVILMISLSVNLFVLGGVYLVNKVLSFDKANNQIAINGHCLPTVITDLQSVNLGVYIVPTASNAPFRREGLYLLTSSGTAIEIERTLASGPPRSALEEVGLEIADFLKINTDIS